MKGNILVPVDFSPHTVVSCNYARALAVMLRRDIVLFHSFFDQIYFSDGGFITGFESGIMFTDEIILDFYRQKEAKLNEIVRDLKDDLARENQQEIEVKYELESGDPEVQILKAISRINPDLIVMGSSGIGNKGLFSGSVARRVMDHTDVPVIAVPENEVSTRIEHVAYMTNFEPADPPALGKIDALLNPLIINYHCIHVCLTEDESEAKASMESLAEKMISPRRGTTLTYHVLSSVRSGLNLQDFLEGHRVDLIAFIPHKRNIFKNLLRHNITKEDLFQTNIPILAIPIGLQAE